MRGGWPDVVVVAGPGPVPETWLEVTKLAGYTTMSNGNRKAAEAHLLLPSADVLKKLPTNLSRQKQGRGSRDEAEAEAIIGESNWDVNT